MSLSQLYGNTATIGSTEYSLTNNSTTIATQTTAAVVSLWLYSSAMAAGDEYQVSLLEKVISGGTQRTIPLATLVGAQPYPFVTGPFHVMHGWDLTVTKVSGTDRSFDWSIRGVT